MINARQTQTTDHLQSHSMLMLPLHVVDVPGHSCHCDDGLFYYIVALFLRVKMFGDFLKQQSSINIVSKHSSARLAGQTVKMCTEGTDD